MTCVGFDTSNYTTSVARFDGREGCNCSRLLDVKPGQLGLRQSDALFAHVKRLPELAEQLFRQTSGPITCVAASTRPRAVEGSYMPCFLAGMSQGQVLADALGVPFYAVSHQQGHLAAVLWSADRLDLLERPFLAWHLSGGTTELLLVEPGADGPAACRIGGTTDVSAGQIIDRTGLLLQLQFPAGKALDALAGETKGEKPFKVKLRELEFSLSGVENKVRQLSDRGAEPVAVAAFALDTVLGAVLDATKAAMVLHPGLPVAFSGGVASNSRLRRYAAKLDAVFSEPAYATDNAMGVAVLGWLRKEGA
jgi:N6-L-threonylcarbamoyladenine synthase